MKKMFGLSIKTFVAIGLGAALFTVLFMYVKVPSFIPSTSFQTAYGVGGFFAALFGPIAGGLIAFIGHALTDAIQYGSPWWSWVIASLVSMFITGLVYPRLKAEEGIFTGKDVLRFNIYQLIGNIIAWVLVAPSLDILIYAEPANKVFAQGVFAVISNTLSTGVIGTLLIFAYAKAKPKKGSLSKKAE